MTYLKSQAISGAGSSLSIGTTPIMVGEIKTSGITGASWSNVSTTNFESGVDEEFLLTTRNNGSLKLAGNRIAADLGQLAVELGFSTGLLQPFVLQLPKTAAQVVKGDSYTFNALVESRDIDVDVSKEISWSVSLKISGPVTLVPGD